MKLFFAGLAALFVGFVGWFSLSLFFGTTEVAGATSREDALPWLIPFFLIMVGGPIWFFIVVPVFRVLRGSGGRQKE
ncbi:MAG: hypothetical protein ABEJ96_03520 [Thiohalorhabdaceae bacterium]